MPVDFGLEGKRALVLASSRGLGLAIARSLAAEGVSVIICGRNAERLKAAVQQLPAGSGGSMHSITFDLVDRDSVARFLDAADARLGGVDILVNNTGGPPPGPVVAVGQQVWLNQFETMVLRIFEITGHFLPGMLERKWGRVLTILSSGVVQPIPNLGISNAMRATLIAWSKTLAGEVASSGVTVNAVIPGRIQTERVDELDAAAAERQGNTREEIAQQSRTTIPVGRYGTAEEFAAVATFLASARASYVTGAAVRVDGGLIRAI